MYKKIIVPVDLAHASRLQKVLQTAADLGRHYNASVCYVGVISSLPGSVARSPSEFAEKLGEFASMQGKENGIATSSHAVTSHDPAVDLDQALLAAIADTGADLVVMASHIPNVTDYIWPSNGGTIASRSSASVFVVRGA
ncbi:universal stress protein [Stappia sp.]|uniref:universal stress protein n=1 Tax=Stappia sp. TaxID=1870903 RepID=UPI003A991B43